MGSADMEKKIERLVDASQYAKSVLMERAVQ